MFCSQFIFLKEQVSRLEIDIHVIISKIVLHTYIAPIITRYLVNRDGLCKFFTPGWVFVFGLRFKFFFYKIHVELNRRFSMYLANFMLDGSGYEKYLFLNTTGWLTAFKNLTQPILSSSKTSGYFRDYCAKFQLFRQYDDTRSCLPISKDFGLWTTLPYIHTYFLKL